MTYRIEDNKIILSEYPSSFKNGLKVYFYRIGEHREDLSSYPVCYTNTYRKQKEYDWVGLEYKILGVILKRRKWLFWSYYEELKEE